MKKLDELDKQILNALKAEDAEILSKFESDDSLPNTMVQLYQGQHRWINLGASLATFVIFGMMLWCGFKFFEAETTHQIVGWATAFLAAFLFSVLMKLWFWLEMLRNSVTREVKRLELQVALLNQSRLEKKQNQRANHASWYFRRRRVS